MPPKRKKAQQGESKTGLVITLVFFILTTIGLGFSTYTGYSSLEGKDNEIAEAKQKYVSIDKERDWFKFQAQLYLAYLGQLQADDKAELGSKRELFQQGQLGQGATDKPRVEALVKGLDKQVPWDPVRKEFRTSYQGLLAEAGKQLENVQAALDKANKDLKDAQKKARDAEDVQRAQRADYDKQLAALTQKVAVDNTELIKKRTELLAKVEELGKRIADLEVEKDTIRTAMQGELRKKDAKIIGLEGQVQQKKTEIASLKERTTQAPKNWNTDWKINSVVDDTPYINLGSADKVTPQLTFSIHSVDSQGTPVQESKGTLEVVDVMAPHLSRAKITSVKDPFKNPIVKGDVLFNPSWNPNRPKRIAIAGLVDLDGDTQNDLDELKRKLERHNVIVDSFMDPRDFSVQGEISVHTDFLILGNGPEGLPNTSDRAKQTVKLNDALKEMRKQSKDNGVEIMSLRKFLEGIGYPLPSSVGARVGY